MILYQKFFKLFILIFLGNFLNSNTFAALIFTSEENGTHESQFFIDSADVANDFIDLEFGTTNTAKLRFDIPNDKFILNRDLNLSSQKKLIFSDLDNSNTANIQAPTNIPADYTLTLPDNDGNIGEVLVSDGSGNLSWSEVSGNISPSFKVGRSSTQSIPTSVWTKVLWEVESFDSNNDFDMVLGRFTPTIPGKYMLTTQVRFEAVGDATATYIAIRKNNGGIVHDYKYNTGNYRTNRVNIVIDANGTDYFEIFVYQSSGSNKNINASPVWSLFSGSRIDGGNGLWTHNSPDIGYDAGNVGVGTTSPGKNLDVVGEIRVQRASYPKYHLNATSNGVDLKKWQMYITPTTGNFRLASLNDAENAEGGGVNIDRSGKVGIGVLNPGQQLDIAGTTQTDYLIVNQQNGVGEGGEIRLDGSGGSSNIQIDNYLGNARIHTLASNKQFQVIGGGAYITGNVGIGTLSPAQKLDVYGNIAISGTTIHTSDIRKKENIFTLENSLENIEKIRGVKFKWKDKTFDNRTQIGVIAQEIEKIYPELVYTNNDVDQTKSVNYEGLIPPLIEAIKELNQKNIILFKEIEKLKTPNQEKTPILNFGK